MTRERRPNFRRPGKSFAPPAVRIIFELAAPSLPIPLKNMPTAWLPAVLGMVASRRFADDLSPFTGSDAISRNEGCGQRSITAAGGYSWAQKANTEATREVFFENVEPSYPILRSLVF